ncbi:MAG: prepilin-type N-terminal cleavage/methylation domain-containing protein [Thermoleophilaceae bacterium]
MLPVGLAAERLLMRRPNWIAARLARECGFTIIEVLVAAALLALGLLALVASLDESRSLGNVSQHESAASHFAERELENWLARPYNEIALTRNPTTAPADPKASTWTSIANSTLPSSPNDERAVSAEVICTVAGAGCPLVGTVNPISTWSDDRFGTRGYVYRYVTWVNDAYCSDANCPGTTDYKRITIAVTITTPTGGTPTLIGQGPKKPIIVSAVKIDPTRIRGNVTGVPAP